MNVIVKKSRVKGEVKAIPSKSYAHRIAICNFLAGLDIDDGCLDFTSNDIEATKRCLTALKNGEKTLDCGESGSTLRFMLPLCACLGGDYEFIGHGKLMERPNEELFSVLSSRGVKCEKADTIKISGKLSSGKFNIRGDISSQYISGLLMALPILDGDSVIELTTELVSAPYVNITLEVLNAFGIRIDKVDNCFYVDGNQKYNGSMRAESDWSNVAFFLVLGAIAGEISVRDLNLDSAQGDKKIMDILTLANAKIIKNHDGFTIKKSRLKAFTFNAEDCPDLVPIACVLAACAKGETVITGVERLKLKESDRIESILKMLRGFNIDACSDGRQIKVKGGKPVGCCVESFNDHRIVMSGAVLGAVAKGETEIYDAQAVNKSYPTFFDDYNKIGGKSNEV